jgi:hypothetical protein
VRRSTLNLTLQRLDEPPFDRVEALMIQVITHTQERTVVLEVMPDHFRSALLVEKASRDLKERLGDLRRERLIEALEVVIRALPFTRGTRTPTGQVDERRER